MQSISRSYRVSTSLSIAYARLSEYFKRTELALEGELLFSEQLSVKPLGARLGLQRIFDSEGERAELLLHVEAATFEVGAWIVEITQHEQRWQREGTEIALRKDGSAVLLATAEQIALAQAAQMMNLHTVQALHCALLAITPTETMLNFTLRGTLLEQALAHTETFAKTLWAVRDEFDSQLLDALRDENKSYEDIAAALFMSPDTVQRRAKEFHAQGIIPRRKPGRKRK